MKCDLSQIEIAKVSSKGQIVIPQEMRNKLDIKAGSMFAIASCDNTLILKKIKNPVDDEDIKTIRLVDEAWGDIEKGKYRKLSKGDFLKELEKW